MSCFNSKIFGQLFDLKTDSEKVKEIYQIIDSLDILKHQDETTYENVKKEWLDKKMSTQKLYDILANTTAEFLIGIDELHDSKEIVDLDKAIYNKEFWNVRAQDILRNFINDSIYIKYTDDAKLFIGYTSFSVTEGQFVDETFLLLSLFDLNPSDFKFYSRLKA